MRRATASTFHDDSQTPGLKWWWKVQKHLDRWCQEHNHERCRRDQPRVAFPDILRVLLERSATNGYHHREFLSLRHDVPGRDLCHQELATKSIQLEFMKRPGIFLKTRTDCCSRLGYSVAEVLGTLVCMLCDQNYCDQYCLDEKHRCSTPALHLKRYRRVGTKAPTR